MELQQVALDIGEALVAIDGCGIGFKQFRPGVGPYGEPQLLRAVAEHLNALPMYAGEVLTKRTRTC